MTATKGKKYRGIRKKYASLSIQIAHMKYFVIFHITYVTININCQWITVYCNACTVIAVCISTVNFITLCIFFSLMCSHYYCCGYYFYIVFLFLLCKICNVRYCVIYVIFFVIQIFLYIGSDNCCLV